MAGEIFLACARLLFGDDLESVFPVDGREHIIALGFQRAPDGAQGECLIVDNQDGMPHG